MAMKRIELIKLLLKEERHNLSGPGGFGISGIEIDNYARDFDRSLARILKEQGLKLLIKKI